MKALGRLLITAGLLGAASAQAAEMTVCIADARIPNNPRYLNYLATTQTRLICEINRDNYRPTLPDLYSEGWRLMQVVGGEQTPPQPGQTARSPLYYLEREASAHPPAVPSSEMSAPDEAQEPAEEPEKKKFSLF